MKWKCFCESIEFTIIKVITPDAQGNGERAVIAECKKCHRRLKFNKWGMSALRCLPKVPERMG